MELRYRREAAVGLFLIAATLVFVFGMMWLRGQSLRRGEVLDVVFGDVMDGLIEDLQKELRATSVVVSHDVRGSFRVADRIALLHQGRIRAVGTPEEFMAAKDVVVQGFLERDFQVAELEG